MIGRGTFVRPYSDLLRWFPFSCLIFALLLLPSQGIVLLAEYRGTKVTFQHLVCPAIILGVATNALSLL